MHADTANIPAALDSNRDVEDYFDTKKHTLVQDERMGQIGDMQVVGNKGAQS